MRAAFFVFPLLIYFSADAQQILKHDKKDTVPVGNLVDLSLEQLMNIKVVTASGYPQTATEAPSTITVITAKQIAERGYLRLEDALRDVPGIDMIHINGYAPTLIYFRGMYGAENLRALLMIDGIMENNILGSNDMAGPAYSLHSIERIEIIWGPVSALYGSNAFGGVINMITKKGSDINGLHAEQGYGTFNTSLENVSFGERKSNIEFNIAGSLYSTDGPKFNNRDPQYSGSYVHRAYSLNSSVSYYTKKTKTTIGYRTYRTPMGWGTYSNSPVVYLGLPPQGNNNSGVLGVLQRDIRGEKSGLDDAYLRTLFVQNEYTSISGLKISSQVVYRETGTADDSYIYITTDGHKLIRLPITTSSSRIAASVSAAYSPHKNHRLSAGIDYYRDNVEAGAREVTTDFTTPFFIDGRDTVVNIHATFLKRKYDIRTNFGSYLQYILQTKLLRKTNFTLGARYDHNSYFGDAFSPRIVVVNQWNEKFTFKLQFGNAFRAPTNLEIYQTPSSDSFHLKKEKIRTYEINAIYTPLEKVRLQVNGFRNELTDVIFLGLLSGFTPDKNPGSIIINGVESIINVNFTSTLSAFANFTFQDVQGKNLVTHDSGKLPGVARVKGNLGATLHLADALILSLTGNWVGQRRVPRTDPYGPVKGYFLTNLAISTPALFGNTIAASMTIRNLLNVKWLDPGFRTADGFLYSTVLEQPGINGLFKISINLR
jgi:outer membrane cobalamin receptor